MLCCAQVALRFVLQSGYDDRLQTRAPSQPSTTTHAPRATSSRWGVTFLIWHRYTLATKADDAKHLAQDIDVLDWAIADADMKKLNVAAQGADTPSWACTA